MTRWIATTTTSMLVILGIAISQIPARAFAVANVDRSGYEMCVHLDRTLSIMSSRVRDTFKVLEAVQIATRGKR